MNDLKGRVAAVTGASRGVGKGIALALGAAGATVYVTGRTEREGEAAVRLSGTIHQTAAEVTALGGEGIAVRCDHRSDAEVEALFQRISAERGTLDILVNNVWGGYEFYNNGTEFWNEREFWTLPLSRWDSMFAAGVRAHYVAASFAARVMSHQRRGLIVNVSSFAAQRLADGVPYGVAKAATDRMAAIMARELRPYDVAVVSLYPGLVRTEAVLAAGDHFDLSNSESPQFVGRGIAALAADPAVLAKSGQWLIAADLAHEYGFTDVDGRQPVSLRNALLDGAF